MKTIFSSARIAITAMLFLAGSLCAFKTTQKQEAIIAVGQFVSIQIQTNNQTELNNSPANNYRVDPAGNINVSLLGIIKVAGLTPTGAGKIITQKAKAYFINPIAICKIQEENKLYFRW